MAQAVRSSGKNKAIPLIHLAVEDIGHSKMALAGGGAEGSTGL